MLFAFTEERKDRQYSAGSKPSTKRTINKFNKINSIKQSNFSAKFAERLNQAQSDSEIRDILNELTFGQREAIAKIPDPQEAKKSLLIKINDSIAENQSQLDAKKRQISLSLWKNCAKWAIASSSHFSKITRE